MADRSIAELTLATSVQTTDNFVLEQDNMAKRLTGQNLINFLLAQIDGHGGINSIAKTSTSGLVDTYTIAFADQTGSTFTVTNGRGINSVTKSSNVLRDTYTIRYNDSTTYSFYVDNGKGITSIAKTSTSGLVDTYTITYNDSTTSTYTVTNGAKGNKGDKGDNSYIWVKYSTDQPTQDSDMHSTADNWMGIHVGNESTAPTSYVDYTWYRIRGDKGNNITLTNTDIKYIAWTTGSGTPPADSQNWTATVPNVPQGNYLWTKYVFSFSDGNSTPPYYVVSRQPVDGTGSVNSVNGINPDPTTHNVQLISFNSDNSAITIGTNEVHALRDSGAVRTVDGVYPVDGELTLSKDGVPTASSTNLITSGGVYLGIENAKDFDISVSQTSETSYTINDERITAEHVIRQDFADMDNDVSWTTSAGSATLTCAQGIPALIVTFYLPQ